MERCCSWSDEMGDNERTGSVRQVSLSCLSNGRETAQTGQMLGQRSDWRERLRANPSRMEQDLTIKLQDDQIRYLTQVEIPATIVDLYFPLEPRPLLPKPFSSLQTSPRLLQEQG